MKPRQGDQLVHAYNPRPGALMKSQDVCEGRWLTCSIRVELGGKTDRQSRKGSRWDKPVPSGLVLKGGITLQSGAALKTAFLLYSSS